jgi:hypothetical protein
MRVQKTVKRGHEKEAYAELHRELLERLWKEEWRDFIDVPTRTEIKVDGDDVTIIVESCMT